MFGMNGWCKEIPGGDLISRAAAIDYFVTNVGFHDEDGYPIEDSDELRKIWTEYFDGIPSAQPEIVRCKDCKYWMRAYLSISGKHGCNVMRDYTAPDDYCFKAERKA